MKCKQRLKTKKNKRKMNRQRQDRYPATVRWFGHSFLRPFVLLTRYKEFCEMAQKILIHVLKSMLITKKQKTAQKISFMRFFSALYSAAERHCTIV
jgi:hypothetical protein